MDISKMYSEDIQKVRMNADESSPNDRYDRKTRMLLPEGDLTRFLRSNEIIAEPQASDRTITVPIHFQYDPWRVAHEFYGDETLFWVILGANNLFSLFELEAGMRIRIPDKTSIYGVNGLMVIGDAS